MTKEEMLKDALKPILKIDFGDYITPWSELRVEQERIEGAARSADGYPFSLIDNCTWSFNDFIKMANAIGEAQRRFKEFEKYERGEK